MQSVKKMNNVNLRDQVASEYGSPDKSPLTQRRLKSVTHRDETERNKQASQSRNAGYEQVRLSVIKQETSEFYKFSNLTPEGKATQSRKDSIMKDSITG